MIMVSHDHQLADSFCNRVVWMDHSKLVADGLPGHIAERDLVRNLNG
jgi:ABC-type polysaccharide/polyol phosphate transport system ATPase subunit